ncbi:MAG: hypothetical protein H7320_08535, partial [Ferruginibacter sp.]|nr:hypothetical protein [Ferruginibacter sp.]
MNQRLISKSRIFLLAATCFVLLVSNKANSQQKPECLKIGTNFGGFNYYTCDWPLKNVFKFASDWGTYNADNTGDYDNVVKRAMTWDADGYPTKIPQYVGSYDKGYPIGVKVINKDQAVRSLFFRGSCPDFPRSVGPQTTAATGLYTVSWEGEGDIFFKNPNNGTYFHVLGSGSTGVTITNTLITSNNAPGVHTCSLYVPENLSTNDGIGLNLVRSIEGSHVRNIKVIMPGFSLADDAENPWHPAFLSYIKPFYSLRFMAAMGANNTTASVDMLWSMRKTKNYFSYGVGGEIVGNSMPYEMIADLCNRLNVHAWVNILCHWDQDHILKFAELLKNELKPGLDVYVEFGNEATWNSAAGFNTFFCLLDEGIQTGETSSQVMARKEKFAWKTFRKVFGPDSLRIKRVLAGQYANPDIVGQRMRILTPNDYDYISCTWYFGAGKNSQKIIDQVKNNTATTASVGALILDDITSGNWINSGMKGHVDLAKSVGKKVICYEGGT